MQERDFKSNSFNANVFYIGADNFDCDAPARHRLKDFEALMKNLFKSIILFAALSVVFSSLTACNNTASTQKGPVSENAPTGSSNTIANPEAAKNNNFPPAPTALLQTENVDLEGKPLKIGDYNGKVVLLNLWAIYCPPCREEMPELVAMQEKYKDKGFEIVGLNISDKMDESVEDIKVFAEKMKLNYQLGYADGKMLSEFIKLTRMQGIPQTIIINREGKMTFIVGGGGKRVIGQMKEAVEKTVNE